MVRTCPHCGLPLSSTGSGEHAPAFPHQQGFVASLADGCLFTTDEAGFPVALCTSVDLSADDARLQTLRDDAFLIPGLPGDRLAGDGCTWIRFRADGTFLPLPAARLRAHAPSGELIWSWFRQTCLALLGLHERGLAHGHLDENLFWLHSGGGPGQASGNRLHLLVPSLAVPADADAREADLRSLGDLFERQLMETPWQRGLDEFRELCMKLRDDPGATAPQLETLAGCVRMAQLQSSGGSAPRKNVAWKKPALIFGILFSISMIATWVFSGTKKKTAAPPPEPTLRKPPPQFEPVVERSSLKWDRSFPLHRVAMNDTVLMYLNPGRVPELEFLAEAAGLLGFTIPAAFLAGDAEAVFSLLLSGEHWKSRVMFSTTRKLVAVEPGTAARVHDTVAGGPPSPPVAPGWVPLTGAGRLLTPDAVTPPPLLLGELGALLSETGYFPENVGQERLVLIFAPPTTLAPRHTVWHWLLGGIRPTYAALRLSGKNDVFTFVLTFERPQDARGAAAFLESTMQTAGAPAKDLMELKDRRIRMQVPLSLLHELWTATRVPAPATPVSPATEPPSVPSPPVVPTEEDVTPPPPVPMEFLNLPEP